MSTENEIRMAQAEFESATREHALKEQYANTAVHIDRLYKQTSILNAKIESTAKKVNEYLTTLADQLDKVQSALDNLDKPKSKKKVTKDGAKEINS